MRMTALDVQNHQFPRRFRGYDIDEVEQFRAALVEDWVALSTENEGLRRRVMELEARVHEMGTHEQALRDALLTAQGVTDDLRRTAEREAQTRVGAAEIQAEKILAAAHRQASRLAQDVRELRALRSRMSGSVRATIETHLALLEGFSQDPEDELDASDTRLEALASPPVTPVRQQDEPITATVVAEPAPDAISFDAPEATEIPLATAVIEPAAAASELFGPPGPPETEAAPEERAAASDVPAGGAAPAKRPERPRPASARAQPPSRGWRVFFDQG